jgi:hypothetical protein
MDMDNCYEVARIEFNISKLNHGINFQNGRGDSGLGYFQTLEEAKYRIKSHRIERKNEKWPYVIIHYENNVGRIAYVEYTEYCLSRMDI